MSLENGVYIISTKEQGRHVGRFPVEDLSLRPKQLFALPQGIEAPKFIIEKNDKGHKIKAFGAPTGVWNNSLFAFLIELGEAQPEDWVITAQPQHGGNVYTVEKQDRSAGWIHDDSDDHRGFHIDVKPLISTKSLPPQFLPTELFVFTRIDRD
ncbi:hypothetical protein QCA50_008954 [Cerrena zonata]|uniref:Uncharacterized protein n=1 Tax=Cerrena zonata TaxID=2478898 RepID=A0AAW0GDN5_9APHY